VAEVDQIAEQLYASPPERFVAARDEAAAAAKSAGDPTAARAIAGLKKPTVAAWAVNLLALRRPDLVDELSELAGALSQAQRQLRGEQLKELSTRRRALVDTLVRQTRSLTAEAGLAAAKLPLVEIESTFNAAFADPAVAAQIRAGRLLKTASYAGFGGPPDLDEPAARAPSVFRSPARPTSPRQPRKAGAEPASAKRPAKAAGPASAKRAGARAPEPPGRTPSGRRGRSSTEDAAAADRARRAELANLRDAVDGARKQEAQARAALDQVITAERQAEQELADREEALVTARRDREEAKEELSRQQLARAVARRELDVAVRKAEQAEAVLDARIQQG
jgi:hypothetical protein